MGIVSLDLAGELRATALGTFHTIIGLVALPASLIAGLLWQNIAPAAAFIYGSVVSIISVVLFFIFGSYFKNGKMQNGQIEVKDE